MNLFNLPPTTSVERNIPKNAFDSYTNSKQKKQFTDLIAKITWKNKISPDTVNLDAKKIEEIQIFEIKLKSKEKIDDLLAIIDKSIPYHIIFIIRHEDNICLSTSSKHHHPVKQDNAVIDWTFKTPWLSPNEFKYVIQLRKSLDDVYREFCTQFSPNLHLDKKSMKEMIEHNMQVESLEKEIGKLKSKISNCKQFNQKVELNMKLKELEKELKAMAT